MSAVTAQGLSPDLVAQLSKSADQHKYDHGHALVLSGGAGHGGAARLAARAALRIGAGLVTLGCPPDALAENAGQLTAVMVRVLGNADALHDALGDARLTALCLGPGLGAGPGQGGQSRVRTQGLVQVALAARRATVLDADALTAFADAPEALFSGLHERVLLTPHSGEFGRLFPDLAGALAGGCDEAALPARRKAVCAAAARCGATVLLKGSVTLIAGSGGELAEVHLTGAAAAPWLATAGSGDVLSGFITGLLARGFAPGQAGETAAWLHGAAGRHVGPGLIAEDLPDALPGVLRALGV
ncbi:NAD(P)H-hydrate dehydratase [Pseudoruegeria sp. SK021]|uniref:NAD(P)H-hydrate dehydratase n=1 Tax=Pseudoruegeria sp. SK021 TaxID=1933035 RepID=UPI000A229FAB|nr:NAD(P)H-hydrate dehydratase [Pseudoruegeria sp. SK021]